MRLNTLLGAALCLRIADAKCYTRDITNFGEPVISWDPEGELLTLTSGCATMADLVELQTTVGGENLGPIYHFSQIDNWYSPTPTGTYYLESDLYVLDGAKLSIDGGESEERECETLLLASNSSMIVNLRAYGGDLDIRDTKIFSWDLEEGDFDLLPETNGRSHISAVSEVITGRVEDTCPDDDAESNGRAKNDMGIARMDILRSEIAYLGYQGTEAYGISYKARGLCHDHSNMDIYNDFNGPNVHVLGDIFETDIHHNWFGHYSWGHNGGNWSMNEVHDNHGYGFDPHDDSDNVVISGNKVYNNGWHGIIASKRCNNALISDNEVYNNGMIGIMLHRSCNDGIIANNVVYDNLDAGVALFETANTEVYGNTFTNNKYGIRFSNGANKNNVYDNIMDGSTYYAIYTFKGSDPQEAYWNEDGVVMHNQIYRNKMFHEEDRVWEINDAEGNVFRNNEVFGGSRAKFSRSERNLVVGNTVPEDLAFETDESCFKAGSQLEASPIC